MRKKVLFLLLAATVALTACGGKKETESVSTEMEAETQAQADVEAETQVQADVEAEAEKAEETEVKETEVKEAEKVTEEKETEETTGDYEKGIVTEEGWESKWIGLRYTSPEGMKMSTEEELNEVMGLGQEMLSEDYNKLQLMYAEMASVYEMMSTDEAGTTNVIITAEKLPMKFSEQEYVEVLIQNLSAVSSVQYHVISSDEIVTIGGVDFVKLACDANYAGASLYQDYYVTIFGDRAVTIAITYTDVTVETAEAVVNAFSAY